MEIGLLIINNLMRQKELRLWSYSSTLSLILHKYWEKLKIMSYFLVDYALTLQFLRNKKAESCTKEVSVDPPQLMSY